jgi:hypothetical protein
MMFYAGFILILIALVWAGIIVIAGTPVGLSDSVFQLLSWILTLGTALVVGSLMIDSLPPLPLSLGREILQDLQKLR